MWEKLMCIFVMANWYLNYLKIKIKYYEISMCISNKIL